MFLDVGFQFQVLNKEEDATLSYDTDATIDLSQNEEPDGREPEEIENEEADGREPEEGEPLGEEQENKGEESQVVGVGQKRNLDDEVGYK